MVRNAQSSAAKALAELPAPAGLELVEATLTGSTHAELESLVAGCSVCICCSGTERITKAADIFGGGLNDPSHPYNVNYRGIEALCSAMKAKGCGKIVRITGSALGKSVFYPFSTLLNVVLSMATKWQNHGEAAIRASGLNYTMIRPPALVDAPRGR